VLKYNIDFLAPVDWSGRRADSWRLTWRPPESEAPGAEINRQV